MYMLQQDAASCECCLALRHVKATLILNAELSTSICNKHDKKPRSAGWLAGM